MVRVAIGAILLLQAQAAAAQDLILVCEGAMVGMFTERAGGVVATDNEGNVVSGRSGSSRYAEVPTTAEFQLVGDTARINLPQPPTCAICVGEKGWRDVRDLTVGEDRITGRIRYGLLSGTTFEIDRRTGTMTSRNGFRGECKPISIDERRF